MNNKPFPSSKIAAKLKDIYELIVNTPRYRLIIFLQFVSGIFSFLGLPLLLPVLNYMNGQNSLVFDDSNLLVIDKALKLIGIAPNFYSILIISTSLIILGQFFVFLSTLIASNAQANLSAQYRKQIFDAYSKSNWLWLLDSRSGEMNFSVITEADMAGVAHLDAQRVLISFIQVLILVLIAVKLSFIVTFFAIGVYMILGCWGVLNSNCVLKLSEGFNRIFKKLSNDLSCLHQNKKFFKTSLLNDKLIAEINGHVNEIASNTKKQNFHLALQYTISTIASVIFLMGVMLFYKQLSLNYSVLLLVLLIFSKISPQFAALSVAYSTIDSHMPFYRSLHNRLQDFKCHREENGKDKFDCNMNIRFQNVCFSYPNGNRVFSNINLQVEPYKTTAFIGSSGVGKSTLLDLLLGLLKPDAGTITYGTVPYDSLDKNSLRSQISYVSQQTTLIDGTMRENITITNSISAADQIEKIIKKVGLDDVIAGLSDGLETNIGENGVKLSGGQRQRVALARALFMNPKILILDEATSSLDVASDNMIQETINFLKNDFTIIIVTHKLSSVRFADKIYVLDKGEICESGGYEELMNNQGKLYLFDSAQKIND